MEPWASVQCPPIPPVPPPPTGIRHGHELVGDKPVAVGLGESWGLGTRGGSPREDLCISKTKLAWYWEVGVSAALILLVAVLIGWVLDLVGPRLTPLAGELSPLGKKAP